MTPTSHDGERVLTREQAYQLTAYDAIERWRQHEPAALHLDESEHQLEELALMTVCAEWLIRWAPISMHRAILAGASPAQVADAAGVSVRDVYERWEKWADVQRRTMIGNRASVSEEAYVTVLIRFAEAFRDRSFRDRSYRR